MIELLNRRATLKPSSGMAGVFYSSAPSCAALDSGCGQFLWFESMPALLEFLRDHAHDMNLGMGPMSMEHQKLRDQAARAVERAIEGELPLPPMIVQLNIALEGFVEIEWIGLFEDLVLGTDDFSKHVRKSFKGEGESTSDRDSGLTNDEVPQFAEFLSSFMG